MAHQADAGRGLPILARPVPHGPEYSNTKELGAVLYTEHVYAFELAAFILLTLNFGFGPLKNLGVNVPAGWLNARKAMGMTGFLLALIHVLMSFMLFSPGVYAKFFEANGTLTLMGGLSMLGGILAFVVLWTYNMSFQTHLREDKAFIQYITSRKFLLWAMLFGAAHLVFMGYKGWLNPSDWHSGIPPVSLVAISFFVAGYVANLFGRK